jgi:hypothetical protein
MSGRYGKYGEIKRLERLRKRIIGVPLKGGGRKNAVEKPAGKKGRARIQGPK